MKFSKEEQEMIGLAEAIARTAHHGQPRRDGFTPYIVHPAAVAKILADAGYPAELVAIGWLHDVIEDSDYDRQKLIDAGIPPEVADVVEMLSKQEGESYDAFIARLLDDDWARVAKAADICANLLDSPSEKQKVKYVKALLSLAEA